MMSHTRTVHPPCFTPIRHAGVRRRAWVRLVMVLGLVLLGVEPVRSSPDADAGPASSPATVSAPIPASRAATNVAIITLRGEINAVTAHSIEKRIERAVQGGADCLVFEINSPGGEVGAVRDISSIIKRCPIQNTIAWINPDAFSGAAVVALACRTIVVAPGATFGDAGVIGMDPLGFAFFQGLKPTERAKGLSIILPELVDSARRNGYDELLVQAIATLGVELWLVRDKETGDQWCVTESEFRAIFGESPPKGLPSVASGGLGKLNEASKEQGVWQDYRPITDPQGAAKQQETAEARKFKPAAPELDGELIRNAVQDRVEHDSRRPDFAAGERRSDLEYVEYVTDGNVLLTLKEAQLKRYRFADPNAAIRDDAELQRYLGATNLRRLDQSWSEHVVEFMTQGNSGVVIKVLLIIVFLMAMFIEMSMPGVGLPGVIALIALAGLVVPPMLIGAANWWMGAMIVGGLALLLLEIFVLPGFGVPGIIGLVMLFVGLVGTFAAPGQLFPGIGPGGAGELARAGSVVLLALFLAGVGIYLFVKYTDRFPIAGRLVLADRQPALDDNGEDMLAAMNPAPPAVGPVAVGAVGRTTTPLRPSGTAEFDDRLIDVVSEFGFVDAGRPVRVVSVTEYRVGVERVRENPAPGPANPATRPPEQPNSSREA